MNKRLFIYFIFLFLLSLFSCHKKKIDCSIAPSTPTVFTKDKNSITIHWQHLQGANNYFVEYKEFLTENTIALDAPNQTQSMCSATITNLLPGTIYTIRVSAKIENDAVCTDTYTPYSLPIFVTTLDDCVPSVFNPSVDMDSTGVLGFQIRTVTGTTVSQAYDVFISNSNGQVVATDSIVPSDSVSRVWVKEPDCYGVIIKERGTKCLSNTAIVCCGPVIIVGDADRVRMQTSCDIAPSVCTPCQSWANISYENILKPNNEGVIKLEYTTAYCPNYPNYVFTFQPIDIGCEASPLNKNQRIEYTTQNPVRSLSTPTSLYVNRTIEKLCPGREYRIKGIPFCSSL